MLAIFISWTIIIFTLFSLGDIFVLLYNKLSKNEERYNIVDITVLGLVFVTILLSFTSLWIPSGKYMLLGCVVIGILHWIANENRLREYYGRVKDIWLSLSTLQKVLLVLFGVAFVVYMLFKTSFFDAYFYHYQQIRWNEEYPVIPGLANLEDRFGFNSSYLLVSAIFSFRDLFGEGVYLLQSAIYFCLLMWALVSLFRSQYSVKYIVLLIMMLVILLTGSFTLSESSTDAIPILCIFYYLAKTTLNSKWYINQTLLACLLPVALVTFKTSSVVFCLASLIVLAYLARNKQNRSLVFLITTSVLIVALWCVRNVIISGYLVYPMYSIDLFSFDWKVPEGIAILQHIHIYEWAKYVFDVRYIYRIFGHGFDGQILTMASYVVNFALLVFVVLSPVVVIYSIVKKKGVDRSVYVTYFVALLCIAFGMISAPDPRFINGYIFGCTFMVVVLILSFFKAGDFSLIRKGEIFTIIILICTFGYVIRRDIATADMLSFDREENKVQSLLIKPYGVKNNVEFTEYPMGDFFIYMTSEDESRTFDRIPASNPAGVPYGKFTADKMQSIKTIEARGSRIKDGFRTKKEYITIINRDVDDYIEQYYIEHRKKYPERYFNSK